MSGRHPGRPEQRHSLTAWAEIPSGQVADRSEQEENRLSLAPELVFHYLCTGFRATECLPNLVKNKKHMQQPIRVSLPFLVLTVLFCVCLIAANLLETKQVTLGPLELTAGLIVFPVSYIINDCLVEVWGFSRARLVIWLGFAMNLLFVLFGALADALPGAAYWTNAEGFHAIFGLAPRIAAASFVAFLVGSFLNAYVMSRMKVWSGGRGFSLRAIASTVVGEAADSLIFFPVALGGVVPWETMPAMMITQAVLKTLYEVVALPVTVRVVRRVKHIEGGEAFDRHVSYNVLKIKDL